MEEAVGQMGETGSFVPIKTIQKLTDQELMAEYPSEETIRKKSCRTPCWRDSRCADNRCGDTGLSAGKKRPPI